MKKRFKISKMCLAAMVAMAVSTGCSTGQSAANHTEEETGQVTLRLFSCVSNYAEIDQKVVDAYEEQNPDVKVQIEYVTDGDSREFLKKTDIMLMGGEPIDIIQIPGVSDYPVRAASGSYLPLDPFFEAEGKKPEDEFNVLYRMNGEVYAMPAELKYGIVLINKDMLDEAGLPVPDLNWTWDDYREYAIKMTKGEGANKVYGSYFHTFADMLTYGVTSAQKGNRCVNADGSLAFANPEFAKFLQFRYDLENVDKASVPLSDIKALNMNYYDQFFNGKVAMVPMSTFTLPHIGNERYPHDFVTTFARIPMWNEGDEHFNQLDSALYAIAKTSQHPQEAFEFLKFWCTTGIEIKGTAIINQKGAGRLESAKRMVENAGDLVDLDALGNLMNDEKWVDSYDDILLPYQSEIENLLKEEGEKYLLDSQPLEDTVSRLMERGNEIVAENK